MFSFDTVNAVGAIALGVLAFTICATIRGMRNSLRETKEAKAHAARDARAEATADRFMARAQKSTVPAKPKPKPVAAPRPKHRNAVPEEGYNPEPTAPVRVVKAKPKTSAVSTSAPAKTPARKQADKKWSVWDADL